MRSVGVTYDRGGRGSHCFFFVLYFSVGRMGSTLGELDYISFC